MSCVVEHHPGDPARVVIRLQGEIDLFNADQIREQIEAAVDGFVRISLDVSDVEYLDSQALRLLTSVSETAAARGAELEVVAVKGSIARMLLDLTAMGDELQIVPR